MGHSTLIKAEALKIESELDSQRKRYRIIILNNIWVEYSFRFVSFPFKFSVFKTDSLRVIAAAIFSRKQEEGGLVAIGYRAGPAAPASKAPYVTTVLDKVEDVP